MRHIWLLLILIVVVSGCGVTLPQLDQSKNVAPETSPNQPGRLTDKGITLKFVEGKPPQDRIILGRPFRVKISLQNWATEPIFGEVRLSDSQTGSDLEAIPGIVTKDFTINGVDEEIKPLRPKEKEIDFGTFTYTNSILTSTAIRAELEYDYKVKFSIPICVKTEDVVVSEAECNSRENFNLNNLGFSAQHAPVTITNIRQETDAGVDGADIVLYLIFEDFGGSRGCIFDGVECVGLDISNAISLEGKGQFKCSPNIITFTNTIKKREVGCTLVASLPEVGYFQNPLRVEFNYPYKTIFSTTEIPIKKPLEERSYFAEQDEAFEAVG